MDKLDEMRKKLDVLMFILLIVFVGIMITTLIINIGNDFLSF